MTAACSQRWALFSGAHDHMIGYKGTTQHGNAVELSELPCGPKANSTSADLAEMFPLTQVESSSGIGTQIKQETGRERTMG